MELKKSPKADLESKKGIFTLVGLVLALLIMIGVFSWSKKEIDFEKMEVDQAIIENEVIEVTREEPPKIEQPKVVAPVVTDMIEIVKDEIKIDTDENLFDAEFNEDTQVDIQMVEEEEEIVEEEVPVFQAEKMPTFQGGDSNAFRMWVQSNVVYPRIAEENNISGKVTFMFTVEKDGSISNVKILSSPDKSLSDECIRVISKSPKWGAGEQRGKAVRVNIVMPIMFTLGN